MKYVTKLTVERENDEGKLFRTTTAITDELISHARGGRTLIYGMEVDRLLYKIGKGMEEYSKNPPIFDWRDHYNV